MTKMANLLADVLSLIETCDIPDGKYLEIANKLMEVNDKAKKIKAQAKKIKVCARGVIMTARAIITEEDELVGVCGYDTDDVSIVAE